MILDHEDYQAIESDVAQGKATAIIRALEKLEREQKVEVKKDLLMELATKADLANMEVRFEKRIGDLEVRFEKRIADLEVRFEKRFGDLESRFGRLETLMKVLIGLAIIGMGFFSPVASDIVKTIAR